MEYLIAPALFQKKICRLPGIGTLSVASHPTITDRVAEQLKAPQPFIYFSAAREDEDNVFNEFTALSKLMKNDIDKNGKVAIAGVGDFVKNENGDIDFLPSHINPLFMPDVTATRVVRQTAEHTILVGDKETTNTQMSGYYNEAAPEAVARSKGRWWIWAIVLGAIALAAIIFYITQHGFNALGNSISF